MNQLESTLEKGPGMNDASFYPPPPADEFDFPLPPPPDDMVSLPLPPL